GLPVTLFLPAYQEMLDNYSFSPEREVGFYFGDTEVVAQFFIMEEEKRKIIAVQGKDFFRRERMYGYSDDLERFIFFSRAVFEYLVRWQEGSFLVHAHDWQSALLCAYIVKYWPSYRPRPEKIVFTIHNLAYQGIGRGDLFRLINLPGQLFTHEYLEFYGNLNLMKAGLIFSDVITTVSPTYAREICSPEFGEGLDGVLRAIAQKKKIVGIVNGIDKEVFNPATDPLLPANYDLSSPEKKGINKENLIREFFPGAKDFSWPVISFVSRLVEQKGVDLILQDPGFFFNLPVYWFFLGTGEEVYEKALKDMEEKYPQVVAAIRFDEELSHLVYAASDLLLLPSRFEPCGISQMIAMNYGALPVVRRVGGLIDTVIDYPFNPYLSTGFQFESFSFSDLSKAVTRALDTYLENRELWNTMVANAMQSDFSWENSIPRYLEIYQER
ncbi:MAG TPA: glycogen/starch synthase, partial [Candidatus Atribacteria bacterium]|nr:glycogen/starch synthase [Candidatus Atribacteria bacterium]